LRLLEAKSLAPGESQIGQIELQQPICTTWGESFVARGLAANEMIGGGQIIDPRAYRVSFSDTDKISRIRELLDDDEAERVAAVAALAGARSWSLDELSQRACVTQGAVIVDRLVGTGVLCRFDSSGHSRWLHREVVAQLEARLTESIDKVHKADPMHSQVHLGKLRRLFVTLEPPKLLAQLAGRLAASGQLRLDGECVALAAWQPQLTAQQTQLLEQILAMCELGGLMPPSVGELAAQLGKSVSEIESLLEVAVDRNELVRLPDKDSRDAKAAQRARLYLHRSAENRLIDQLVALQSDPNGWTVSRFGEIFSLSRKYAIPLCNHLDQTGITSRQGDLRRLHKSDSIST
jgi:selenocysteine-specific elongation factor